jgi:hypothetical protein
MTLDISLILEQQFLPNLLSQFFELTD